MNRKDKFIAAFAAAVIIAAAGLWLAPAGLARAPDITLTTLDGRNLHLSELKGKPVLVTFWATTCVTCVKEIPELVALHEEFAPAGLSIIGIAMQYDPPNQVLELAQSRRLPYVIAIDIDGSAARAFGEVTLTPTTFLIAPDGRMVRQRIGEFDPEELRNLIRQWLQGGETA